MGQGGLDIQQVDEALTRLGELDERQERIVELRFFSGFTVEEVAMAIWIAVSISSAWRVQARNAAGMQPGLGSSQINTPRDGPRTQG